MQTDSDTLLKANLAYALGLFTPNKMEAQLLIREIQNSKTPVSQAGGYLLSALSQCCEKKISWPRVFEEIGQAVESGDNKLWINFQDDLERLIWFVLSSQRIEDFLLWMQERKYPLKFVVFYNGVLAAASGADQLYKISPEIRERADVLYQNLSRLTRLYS